MNYMIAIVTGKTYKESVNYFQSIKHLINFFIGNNGAILIDSNKKEIWKTTKNISFDFINKISKDIEILNGAIQIITSKKTYIESHINLLKSNPLLLEEFKKIDAPYLSEKGIKNIVNHQNNVVQLTIMVNHEFINELLTYFKSFYGFNYEFRISSNISLDVNVLGVNRYEAINTIISLYNIALKNIFFFGNYDSDIESMKNITNSYNNKDSAPKIKKYAKHIIDTNKNNTLAFEIQKILEQE